MGTDLSEQLRLFFLDTEIKEEALKLLTLVHNESKDILGTQILSYSFVLIHSFEFK